MIRRALLLLFALLLAGANETASARRAHAPGVDGALPPGLPPGRYSVKIIAPTLDPSMALDEQIETICYLREEARVHANPIMPAPERAGCTHNDLLVGDVLTFDGTCKDGLHNLRLTAIGPNSYSGKYLYVSKGQPRVQLEPFIQMHREGDCP